MGAHQSINQRKTKMIATIAFAALGLLSFAATIALVALVTA